MGIFSKWVESLDYQYEILPSCSRQKSPRSTCTNCADICEQEAISLKDSVPIINHEKCNECGKCLSACPVQAIAGIFPKREVCQSLLVGDENTPPSVNELLVYAKKGIKGILCEEELSDRWKRIIKETNEILLVLDEPILTIQKQKIDPSDKRYTRRELFFSWKQETNHLMKEFAPAKWRFNQEALDLSRYYPNHQFADISLNSEKCTLCGACEKLCNKSCLTISDGAFMIFPQACSACQLCEDICPEQAISVTSKVSQLKNRNYLIHEKTCNSCSQTFQTLFETNEQCFPCSKKSYYLSSW